ncbi:hypothetical protein AK88_03560 [Plasmodium fragile]|uniref:Uncharacterized protein n=1 Tax=Plasmodium fragile TaxID=5857 RepID=A0A0D9QLZ5_PLAFR|nr:uncharacterized protein AK88_03560 [Plasmodium fragile]KJP86746.1 hypothetical protein AK88_03560 [Plasmodium fragile]
MSRLLTVELDMQTPQANNKLLTSPGKGQPKKVASGQKPGKPKAKVTSEGSLPPSQQNKVHGEQKETKPKGNAVKRGTNKQTPEQHKAPASPNKDLPQKNASGVKSGKPDSTVGSDGLLISPQNKAQSKKKRKKPKGIDVNSETNKQTPEQHKPPVSPSRDPHKQNASGENSETSDPKVTSDELIPPPQDEVESAETGKKPRGLFSALKHTIITNKQWTPFTVGIIAYFIIMITTKVLPKDQPGATISLIAVAVSILIMLLIVLFRFYHRRGKLGFLNDIFKCKTS